MTELNQTSIRQLRTSRSKHVAIKRCDRLGMWQYGFQLDPTNPESLGGLSTARPNIDMLIGTIVHEGIEGLFAGMSLEAVVAKAMINYDQILNPILGSTEIFYEVAAEEGRAMAEALLAVFNYHPMGLRNILETCDVVLQEKEIPLNLTEYLASAEKISADNSIPDVILDSRPDLIIRSKADGQLYVIDFKTGRSMDDRTASGIAVDDQSIGQSLAASWHLKEPVVGEFRYTLLKGSRTLDKDLNAYVSNSPLIKPYGMYNEFLAADPDAITVNGWSLSPDKYWSCTAPHKISNRSCSGGKRHILGDDWQQLQLWKYGSISEWIRLGIEKHPEVFMPTLHISNLIQHDEVTNLSWAEQVLHTELRFQQGLDLGLSKSMNSHFPQNRSNCAYPYKCQFYFLCHEVKNPTPETLIKLGYVPRVNHHAVPESEE